MTGSVGLVMSEGLDKMTELGDDRQRASSWGTNVLREDEYERDKLAGTEARDEHMLL